MKAPIFEVAPVSYSKRFFDTFARVLTLHFTIIAERFSEEVNRSRPVEITADTTMGDDEHTFRVLNTGVTMEMPKATINRVGKEWTVIMDTTGWVDVAVQTGDNFVITPASSTIRLLQKGTSVSLRCLSESEWGIV